MRILVACEFSGTVRDAFIRHGHDAWSCDLLPSEGHNVHRHFQTDIRNLLEPERMYWHNGQGFGVNHWDMLIAFPDCTFLTVAGAKWFYHPDDRHLDYAKRRPHPLYPNRWQDQTEALDFVRLLLAAPIPAICVENPIGVISTAIRKPDQIIHPYQFGHDASKSTCLWLKNLPKLVGTKYIKPRIIEHNGKKSKRWGNQCPSGSEKTGPSADRWKIRSRTYPGIADAMADQFPQTTIFTHAGVML